MAVSKSSIAHLDFAVQKNCYATGWSYGEICVGCGCCGRRSKKRDKARLAYWQYELDRCLNFRYWCGDSELRAIQEKNLKLDIAIAKRMVKYYGRHKL